MACERKKRTGSCNHFQCPYPESNGGMECVEVIENYCEIGENCNDQCEYSWKSSEKEKVDKAYDNYLSI